MQLRHIYYQEIIALLWPLSFVVSQSAFMITKGELHPTYKGFISFANTVTNVSSIIMLEFGVFMCTEPGTYHFTIGAATMQNEPFRIVLKHNRDSVATLYGSFNDYQQVSQTAIIQLQNGDYVYPFVEVGEIFESPIEDRAYTVFTGFQIGIGSAETSGETSIPTRSSSTSGRNLSSTTSYRSSSTATITAQEETTSMAGSTSRSPSAGNSITTSRGTSSESTTGRVTTITSNTARPTTRVAASTSRASGTGTTHLVTDITTQRAITTTSRPFSTTSRAVLTSTRPMPSSTSAIVTSTRLMISSTGLITTSIRSTATSIRSITSTTRLVTTSGSQSPIRTTVRSIMTTIRPIVTGSR